jgi:rubrerythrin
MKADIRGALERALQIEEASYKMYISLSKEADSTPQRLLFEKLAIEELRHESLLKEYLRSGSIQAAREKARARFDRSSIVSAPLDSTIKEAILFAIKKELEAQIAYSEMARDTKDALAKGLFLELAEEEKGHERLLLEEYERLE